MNQLTTYHYLLRGIILLTFTSLFLADSIVYWVSHMEKVTIELCDFGDGETEKEEKKNEELFDDKFPIDFLDSQQALLKKYLTAFTYIDSTSSPNREILTPPPKCSIS